MVKVQDELEDFTWKYIDENPLRQNGISYYCVEARYKGKLYGQITASFTGPIHEDNPGFVTERLPKLLWQVILRESPPSRQICDALRVIPEGVNPDNWCNGWGKDAHHADSITRIIFPARSELDTARECEGLCSECLDDLKRTDWIDIEKLDFIESD